MLLPDNIHPQQSILYKGAVVLGALQEHGTLDFLELFKRVQSREEISMPVFVLCLDWLYLVDVVTLSEHGVVALCS